MSLAAIRYIRPDSPNTMGQCLIDIPKKGDKGFDLFLGAEFHFPIRIKKIDVRFG